MTDPSSLACDRLASRLRRLVADARRARVVVVVDSDSNAIRLLTPQEHADCYDAAGVGEAVRVDDAQRNSMLVSASNKYE